MASNAGSNVGTDAPARDPKEIAQAELARWKRRLGPLTHEQEVGIENLVIATANRASLLSGLVMQSLLECRMHADYRSS